MRFSSVEVERAYWDYLDSLEDWPPPAGEVTAEWLGSTTPLPDLDGHMPMRVAPPPIFNS